MRYAETGFNLEIDLSQGSIDKVETVSKDSAIEVISTYGGQSVYLLSDLRRLIHVF
jgi:hypothetical protein